MASPSPSPCSTSSGSNSTEESALNDMSALKDGVEAIEKHEPNEDVPITYSEADLETFRNVRAILMEKHNLTDNQIGKRFLAYTCIQNKNRVNESVKKYLTFFKAIRLAHMDGVYEDSLWTDDGVSAILSDYYAPCGKDYHGRSIFWISGTKPITEDMEATSVKAGIAFCLAIHADERSLREGITFVIDSTNRKFGRQPNDSKLQKINQSYPLRPQSILIAGTSFAMRVVINGLIKVAFLFTKEKVLKRIKFVSVEQAMQAVPKASAPKYLGGGGGDIEDVTAWAKQRFDRFPIPDL